MGETASVRVRSTGQDWSAEVDTNIVERAGSGRGGEHWAVIASLIETCELNDVNPHAYLTDTLERLVEARPQSRIDDLIPWAYAAQ